MKKLSGQCTLEEFFISMTKSDTLMNKYNGFIYEFNLFKKLRNDSFIKEILIKPIIFYLKVDSFANSGENIKIDEIIKDIVATEDYNILCLWDDSWVNKIPAWDYKIFKDTQICIYYFKQSILTDFL